MTNVVNFPDLASERSTVHRAVENPPAGVLHHLGRRVFAQKAVQSEASRNEQLRGDRRRVWNRAQAKVDVRRALLDLHRAERRAREQGVVLECGWGKEYSEQDSYAIDLQFLDALRDAELELMLTPAPTIAMVNWKLVKLKGYPWYGSDPKIERAIIHDRAFLAAHPARQSAANEKRRGQRRKPRGVSNSEDN